jgi:hypothetical protein
VQDASSSISHVAALEFGAMTSGTYGQWEPTALPYGAASATKMSEPVAGGVQTTRICTYSGATIVDEHTDTATTANGTTTISSNYERTHWIGEIGGAFTVSKGHTTIIGTNLHVTWQLSFTDSQGRVTRQVGATALTYSGVVQETGAQSVTTTYPDGTAAQVHLQWSRPNLTGEVTRRTQTTEANNNTTTTVDSVWSSGNSAWQVISAEPPQYGADPALDTLPPPFGPMGPVIGGDVVFEVIAPSPTTPSTGST